jgi:hypothetical protein
VERSVTIAGISTRELVTKDYVTEQNEEKLKKAGHLMAQKLAGSLALVTCKEPMRTNLTTQLRHFLSNQGFTEVRIFRFYGSFVCPEYLYISNWCQSKSSRYLYEITWRLLAPLSRK